MFAAAGGAEIPLETLFASLCSSLGQKPKRISHPDSELGPK